MQTFAHSGLNKSLRALGLYPARVPMNQYVPMAYMNSITLLRFTSKDLALVEVHIFPCRHDFNKLKLQLIISLIESLYWKHTCINISYTFHHFNPLIANFHII